MLCPKSLVGHGINLDAVASGRLGYGTTPAEVGAAKPLPVADAAQTEIVELAAEVKEPSPAKPVALIISGDYLYRRPDGAGVSIRLFMDTEQKLLSVAIQQSTQACSSSPDGC